MSLNTFEIPLFCRHRDCSIENLPKPFAVVATDLNTGGEIWLKQGPLWEAVRFSISLPGIFTPARRNDQWLVDGGLVNPVPVSLCRAIGAEIVIAVNLNGALVGRHLMGRKERKGKKAQPSTEARLLDKLTAGLKKRATPFVSQWLDSTEKGPEVGKKAPGLLDVLAGSINIMQDRITGSRMAGDPSDVMLAPRLAHMGLLEFNRAAEAIEEGRDCVRRMLPALQEAGLVSDPAAG